MTSKIARRLPDETQPQYHQKKKCQITKRRSLAGPGVDPQRDGTFCRCRYVPQLDIYIGPETPNPLFITALKSKDSMPAMEVIQRNILGLTKSNHNSCNRN